MPRSSSSVDESDRIGYEPVSPFRWCRETAITRKNEQNGVSIDLAATEAEIGTVVAQLGLGRHRSGPPHGARTSHIRQGLSTGLLERRRRGDQTLNFAESLGDSRPRRSSSHERSLATGARESEHEVNRATERDDEKRI
jgi:hypothetical protein